MENDFKFLLYWIESDEIEIPHAAIERAVELLSSADAAIRSAAARVAGFYYRPSFDKYLIKLLQDSDSLVQVNACDSLGNSSDEAVCEKLIPFLMHEEPLLRGYSIVSYSNIILNAKGDKKSALQVLSPCFEKESDDWVRVFGIEALAQLGNEDVLQELPQYISSDDYHARIVAIKCAQTFLGKLDLNQWRGILQKQHEKEEVFHIKEDIEKLLQQIETVSK